MKGPCAIGVSPQGCRVKRTRFDPDAIVEICGLYYDPGNGTLTIKLRTYPYYLGQSIIETTLSSAKKHEIRNATDPTRRYSGSEINVLLDLYETK